MNEDYDEDYFENGEATGKSCYTNYRWMPTRTLETASELIRKAGILKTDIVLDIGCAKGFLVKAFHWLGYINTYGIDTSKYAIDTADEEIKNMVTKTDISNVYHLCEKKLFDITICKDTAEHIPYDEIDYFLTELYIITKYKTIIIVPLGDGKKYNIPRYEKDITHRIREPREWWIQKIKNAGFRIMHTEDDLVRIKSNWNVPNGNLYIEAVING